MFPTFLSSIRKNKFLILTLHDFEIFLLILKSSKITSIVIWTILTDLQNDIAGDKGSHTKP